MALTWVWVWHLISRGFTSTMTWFHVKSINYPSTEGIPLHKLQTCEDEMLRLSLISEFRSCWYIRVSGGGLNCVSCVCVYHLGLCVFFPGYSSAPELLEPALWPRTWLCELMWGQQRQHSSNWVKSTHDAYENTWKCGELKLYFSPSAGGLKKKKKTSIGKEKTTERARKKENEPRKIEHTWYGPPGGPVTTDLIMRVNVRTTTTWYIPGIMFLYFFDAVVQHVTCFTDLYRIGRVVYPSWGTTPRNFQARAS